VLGLSDERLREAAWIALKQLEGRCPVDPRIEPLLKSYDDPQRARWRQRLLFPALLALAAACAWAVWRTQVAGGVVLWIPAFGTVASLAIAQQRFWVRDARDRQQLDAFMAWSGLSVASTVLLITGRIVQAMIVGLANCGAVTGAALIGLRAFLPAPARERKPLACYAPALAALLAVACTSAAYLLYWNLYKGPVVSLQRVDTLVCFAWRAETRESFVAANATAGGESYGVLHYEADAGRLTAERRLPGTILVWPSPDRRYVLVLRMRRGRRELLLTDIRLQRLQHLPAAAAGKGAVHAFWCPDSARFLLVTEHKAGRKRAAIFDRQRLAERELKLKAGTTVLAWHGPERLWTYTPPPDGLAAPVRIYEQPVAAAGRQARLIVSIKQPCRALHRTAQPGIFLADSTGGPIVIDALRRAAFTWGADWPQPPTRFPPLAVLHDRHRAVLVADASRPALLLVDWQKQRLTKLWQAPGRDWRLDEAVYVSPDGARVAVVALRSGRWLELGSAGWLVLDLPPRLPHARWLPHYSLPITFAAIAAGPPYAPASPWLDSQNLLLTRLRFSLAAADFIRGIDLYRRPVD